jgi:DNA-binding beta-propeller fold protein YncE
MVVGLIGVLATTAASEAARVTLVAGGGTGGDGSPARAAKLNGPFGVAFDRSGTIYFVEIDGNKARKIDSHGIVTTIVGTGEAADGGDGGPGTQARLNHPHSLVLAPGGNLYIADTLNSRVRCLNLKSGIITTVAGTGAKGYGGDGGPGTAAQFDGIYSVALDHSAQNLYLADLENRRIRVLHLKSGIVETVAGNGERGVPKDGADARASPLVDPRAVAVDSQGLVYVLERSGNALRVVDRQGKIRTVVGTGQRGLSGDGGDARLATMDGPKHLCIDADDNVIIADTENHVIRKYLPREGKIVRVAGTGHKGTTGLDGPPEQVELNQPHGVFFDPRGRLYITDSSNDRILRIDR